MLKFRLDKRLVVDSTLFGVVLTLLVVAADVLGLLTPLDLWLYDQRALRCQHWTPPPTDKLVHVDIDDKAYDSIGRWPWHRSVLADILDEIHVAGAKVVGLDLLLSEAEAPELRENPDEKLPPDQRFERVDHDARLADAINRAGSVVVATRLPFKSEPASEVFAAMCEVLAARPTITESEVTAALRNSGMTGDDLPAKVAADFHSARRRALFDRIRSRPEDLDGEKLLSAVLPGFDTSMDSPPLNAFKGQYQRVKAGRQFRRFALPRQPDTPPLFVSSLSEAPIERFGAAASAGGFVDYLRSADGKVRSVPLFVQSEGLVYPQFGVALACRFLGADPGKIRLNANSVVIPRPTGDLIVPVRTVPAGRAVDVDAGKDVPMVAGVSWFGGGDWVHMYDRLGAEKNPHVSIARVWDACLAHQKIERNNRTAIWAIGLVGSSKRARQFEQEASLEQGGHGVKLIDTVLKDAEFAEESLRATPPAERSEADQFFFKALGDLRNIRGERQKTYDDLAAARRGLRSTIDGRAVLVGWVATAAIADFLPTSLHPNCPGVVMHGVIFNQIVNGEVWRTLPRWATLLTTILVGLLTTLAVSFLSPARALAAAAVLLAGYLLVNGFLLFDYGNLILGAAGPVVAIASVWSGGTLAKLGMERLERARITRRFRSYADPKLVDYVIKHPEVNVFEGQVRELTVVYIDLVGFTKLTEKMGSETVQLLNALWSALVPVIRRNDALVNKFLGDGIMFFYGAPEQSPFHARDAVNTVLQVSKALADFNERSAAKEWPQLALRFGISTGKMIVGDTGEPEGGRTDYSVIGDYANLGARLESANKIIGTTTLMTDRTVELAGDGFLFRPVGKLCVVGKQASVMTYEVVTRLDEATDAQKELAADTKQMVDCFLAGRVRECLEAVEKLESAHGLSKLTAIYRERCEYFLQGSSSAPFDCQIVLTEK